MTDVPLDLHLDIFGVSFRVSESRSKWDYEFLYMEVYIKTEIPRYNSILSHTKFNEVTKW
jgi:hypothetical protein